MTNAFEPRFAIIGALAISVTACAAVPSTQLTPEDQATRDQIAALVAEDPNVEISIESADREQRLVCRRIRVLGSNIPQRVCHDPAAVERAAETARQTQRALARQSPGTQSGSSAEPVGTGVPAGPGR